MKHRIALTTLTAMIASAGQLAGQTPLPRPTITKATVIVGPASLAAWSATKAHVTLTWPAVNGAERYRITRIENNGTPEITIEEMAWSSFVFEGSTCDAAQSQRNCIYEDVSKLPSPGRLAGSTSPIRDPALATSEVSPAPTVYYHAVQSGKVYTYRVWAIYPGPVLSPPSPPATVQVK